MLRADYGAGCRLVRLDSDGELRVLSEGLCAALEPDVSFDGERVLFAGKRTPGEPWNVWEVDADGGAPRQITRDAGNCRTPAYQSSLYTIDSREPWMQIMFVSDVAGALNEVADGPAWSLYSARSDGSGLRRLTMNPSDDLDPHLMGDGRVLCSSWQRMDASRGKLGRFALFGLNADGTDYALYSAAGGADAAAPVRHMACQTRGGLVAFVEAEEVGWDGAGRLGAVGIRRPHHSYRSITAAEDGLFHSPTPLPDGAILAARRPADGSGTHALVRVDPESGDFETVYDDPEWHDFHARALVPREQPDGRSSSVAEKFPTGKLYCLNAYLTAPEWIGALEPGAIRSVRVIEGVTLAAERRRTTLAEVEQTGRAGPGSSVHGLAPLAGRRVLGVAPVESDGSFQVEVPANVPIQLQTLDEEGLALFSCGWTWAKNREWRGCIGCHEDPELTPENRFFEALRKDATQLLPPVEERRAVTFLDDVRPILDRRCVECHGGGQGTLDLSAELDGFFDKGYWSLLQGQHVDRDPDRYVVPGRARTSPLVWLLFGRNTARPWDGEAAEAQPALACGGGAPLEAEERAILVEWIDLGAFWDGGVCAPPQSDETHDSVGGKR